MSGPRTFLFLQGPHGPFFARLGGALAARGHGVKRINLNGGDRRDWPGAATDYRGTLRGWPVFLDDFIVAHGITDLILFGDCRPHHSSAHGVAGLRGVRVHVLEEGYIRPDFVTLEEGGVNGHSSLPRDPAWFRAEAARLGEAEEAPLDPVPSTFRRRALDTGRYLFGSQLLAPLFPFYRTHRPLNPFVEWAGWALRLATDPGEKRRSAATIAAVLERPFFLLPLQLNADYQIRIHSPFGDMRAALRFIVKSFAAHAPADATLLIKRHPLDPALTPWRRIVGKLARRYGIADRVAYVSDGDLAALLERCRGAVMVNSTVGTLALNLGTPIAVLGEAVYDVRGISHEGPLDDFWAAPRPPDAGLWRAVKRVLVDRTLIRGGFLSEAGLAMLVDNAVVRLLAPAPPPLPAAVGDNVTRVAHWR